MLKLHEVAVLIYETKHIEVPRFITMEPVDKRDLSTAKFCVIVIVINLKKA